VATIEEPAGEVAVATPALEDNGGGAPETEAEASIPVEPADEAEERPEGTEEERNGAA
jgi:hypothetical protein